MRENDPPVLILAPTGRDAEVASSILEVGRQAALEDRHAGQDAPEAHQRLADTQTVAVDPEFPARRGWGRTRLPSGNSGSTATVCVSASRWWASGAS
jgi:hypothetical protein